MRIVVLGGGYAGLACGVFDIIGSVSTGRRNACRRGRPPSVSVVAAREAIETRWNLLLRGVDSFATF